jgi:L-methionine (R)-S-oxide reductase
MKEDKYKDVLRSVEALIEGETDLISVMSTISCELYHAFEHFNWVGFYRLVDDKTLKVGPYQGGHGCLTITIERGVCGRCVRDNKIQIENDVRQLPHHIACSSETKSEIVLPVRKGEDTVVAVLDIDSTTVGVFDEVDEQYLKRICDHISRRY